MNKTHGVFLLEKDYLFTQFIRTSPHFKCPWWCKMHYKSQYKQKQTTNLDWRDLSTDCLIILFPPLPHFKSTWSHQLSLWDHLYLTTGVTCTGWQDIWSTEMQVRKELNTLLFVPYLFLMSPSPAFAHCM